MKILKRMAILAPVVLVAAMARPAIGQQNPPSVSPDTVAYRVQVVLSEYDGATKISSLPYTIPVVQMAGEARSQASMRVGVRVPVNTSGKNGENSIQYSDVGTNVDVRIRRADADRYEVEVTLDRSWLYIRGEAKDGKVEGRAWAPGDPAPSLVPLTHQFRTNVEFLLRDGKPSETVTATDPVTGHSLKMDVVLTVAK